MKRLLLLALLVAAPAAAQEVAVPDTPVSVTVKGYAIIGITTEREPDWRMTITFRDDQQKIQSDNHFGPSWYTNPATGVKTANPDGAEDLIKQMNTANMSVKSMNRRALEHLVAHGKIPPSTVTGTPQVPGSTELDRAPVVPKPAAVVPPPKPTPAPIEKEPEVFQLEVDKTKVKK